MKALVVAAVLLLSSTLAASRETPSSSSSSSSSNLSLLSSLDFVGLTARETAYASFLSFSMVYLRLNHLKFLMLFPVWPSSVLDFLLLKQ